MGAPPVFPSEAGIQRWGVGPTLTRTPFLNDNIPATLPFMHSRTDNKGRPPPRRCARTIPGCFPIYTPGSRYRLFPPGAKRLETKRIQPAEGRGMGAPPSFRRKPESRAPGGEGRLPRQGTGDGPPLRLSGGSRNPEVWGRGAPPDTNPFPRRQDPRYPSLHAQPHRQQHNARPQGDAPAQPQVVFLSAPPDSRQGCFLPAKKTRNETNPISRGWGGQRSDPGEDCATVRAWTPTEAAPGTAPGTPR